MFIVLSTTSFKTAKLNRLYAIVKIIDPRAPIPLLLFTLGTRLIGINFGDWKLGVLGSFLCPLLGLIVALAAIQFIELEHLHYQQLILFSVLPPAVLNHMMAEKYQQQPETVASIVMIGNIGSLIVLPIALYYVL